MALKDWDWPQSQSDEYESFILQLLFALTHNGKGKPVKVPQPGDNAVNKIDDAEKAALVARFRAQSTINTMSNN